MNHSPVSPEEAVMLTKQISSLNRGVKPNLQYLHMI